MPENEYDSYVGGVYRLLTKGVDTRRLAAHLVQLERFSMGLPEREVVHFCPAHASYSTCKSPHRGPAA